jgi:hypothetical protein
MRCVDKDTEFLTPTGWKQIDKYQENDLVAQWDKDTGRAEFVSPLEYIVTPCDEFIHLKTAKGIDQMLTPKHRVPYYTRSGDFKETTAGYIHSVNVDEASRGWPGFLPVVFRAPVKEGVPLTAEQIRVMVMVMADGYFPSPSTARCHIRVKKDRKKIRARALLSNAGIVFSEVQKDFRTAKGYSVFKFYAPRREKEFAEWWWDSSEDQLKVISDEVRYWDGSLSRDAGAFRFSSYSEKTADFVQYACVASGMSTSKTTNTRHRRTRVDTEYSLHITPSDKPKSIVGTTGKGEKIINSKTVPSEDGLCYCFSVPSTYFIARRGGRVFITGNTGKTLSALWAADYLRQAGKVKRTLIVAPLSTLWDVWQTNIFESFPLRTFAVLHGDRKKRLALLAQPHDFYIVNHHGVQIIENELALRKDINLVIVDEIATFRSAKNKRSKNSKGGVLWAPLNEVLNKQGIVRAAWGLTGSPTPTGPTDAFGQSKLITPEKLKGHFTAWKQETMLQVSLYKWVPKKDSAKSVARILSPSIRFERTVCTDMEPCYIERRAQLSEEQQKAYRQLVNQAATDIRGSMVTAVNAANLLSKIIQVSAGVAYAADGSLARLDFGPRLSVLEELIEENNEKVLVFVPFTGVLEALATELRKRWSVAIVNGDVSPAKRTQVFREFRSLKDPWILLCHPDCMAHGLDLTTASLSIWYAPYLKSEKYQQANARTDGSKQTAKIDIARIYATPEEKRAYAVLEGNGRYQDIVLELSKEKSW